MYYLEIYLHSSFSIDSFFTNFCKLQSLSNDDTFLLLIKRLSLSIKLIIFISSSYKQKIIF